ncbi:hypothetical protein HPB47_015895 [Ixodes persulcatus]|uniref:Uncharacterized protein n=1 Tax=Ixodes persulcatus TaxID=34615 RepID=A0AC60QTG9_IXOPE|nr:hypothetical protein HPB47_015895 [Ixodes persulcatus]
MAAVVKVLQPLQQATAESSADRYPTRSQEIPLPHCTHVVIQQHKTGAEEAAPFSYNLARSFATRFPDLKISPVPALAMLIDPRCDERSRDKPKRTRKKKTGWGMRGARGKIRAVEKGRSRRNQAGPPSA